jgi:hypothetical protein
LHYFDSDFKDYGNKWVYTLNDATGCSPAIAGDEPCPAPQFSTSSRLPDYGIAVLGIGGKHVLNDSWISWDVSAARSRQLAAAGNPGVTFKAGVNNDTAQIPLTDL